MSENRKWRYINVQYEDGDGVTLNHEDFEKMEKIKPVLEALVRVKGLKHDLDRLLGEERR